MTDNTAPTITIDGVTSNPGEPISFLRLECGDLPIVEGHGFSEGRFLTCPDCQKVTAVEASHELWRF